MYKDQIKVLELSERYGAVKSVIMVRIQGVNVLSRQWSKYYLLPRDQLINNTQYTVPCELCVKSSPPPDVEALFALLPYIILFMFSACKSKWTGVIYIMPAVNNY